MRKKKEDCKYPDCFNCDRSDCDMAWSAVHAMMRRRRYRDNIELEREKAMKYRWMKKAGAPVCDKCASKTTVQLDSKAQGRLCVDQMRMIGRNVTICPLWCPKLKKSEMRLLRGAGKPRAVVKLDKTTGAELAIYESVRAAARANGIKQPSAVSGVCRGTAKTAGGYKWRYADERKDTEKNGFNDFDRVCNGDSVQRVDD
jgi:hypothetical protein